MNHCRKFGANGDCVGQGLEIFGSVHYVPHGGATAEDCHHDGSDQAREDVVAGRIVHSESSVRAWIGVFSGVGMIGSPLAGLGDTYIPPRRYKYT